MIIERKIQNSVVIKLFWSILLLFIAYYLYRAFYFRFIKEGLGPTFWNKQFWFILHMATAVPIILIGPLQFWVWFRKRYMKWHRLLGKIYVIGALVGGITAFYLAVTIQFPESVVPLMLSSFLWVLMTASAWITIKRKNVQAHRLFMIRSYTLALTFIFVRIINDLVTKYNLLSFIPNDEAKAATYEWGSWVVPVLVVEFFIAWLPSLRQMKVKKLYSVKTTKAMES